MIKGVTQTPTITVLAIHGNGGGDFRWERLPTPLSDTVRLEGPSLPGFAGRPLPSGPVTMSTFVDAIVDDLEAIEGKRLLLGHGIGGAVALDATARRPDRVDGLIHHAPVAANLESRLFPKIMSSMFIRRAAKATIASLPVRKIASRLVMTDAPQSYVERFFGEYRRADAFEVMFDLLTAEWFDDLPTLDTPAVLLWGQRDRIVQIVQAEAVEKKLSRVSRHIEDRWGHYPMIEQPADYAHVVADLATRLVDRETP